MTKGKNLRLTIKVILLLTFVTWAQGWYMVYDQRRVHSPICFPVAPFVIFAHDTNDNGPAADGFYIAYLFGVHSLGERVTWTCQIFSHPKKG